MTFGLLLALAFPALAAEPIYFLQGTQNARDVGGINENDRALADGIRKTDLTNGGSVSGNLTLTGDQALTGDLTISGSGNGITFPDGTVQTTAGSYLRLATHTVIMVDITTTDTTGRVAFAGSTVTWTAGTGCTYHISFGANLVNNTGGIATRIGFLLDGAFVSPFSATVPSCQDVTVGGAEAQPYRCTVEYTGRADLSAGSHSISLPFSVNGAGTGTLDCSPSACNLEVLEQC